MLAVLLAAFGSVFDLGGESLAVLVLVERALPVLGDSTALWEALSFENVERISTLLTAGAAVHALYARWLSSYVGHAGYREVGPYRDVGHVAIGLGDDPGGVV